MKIQQLPTSESLLAKYGPFFLQAESSEIATTLIDPRYMIDSEGTLKTFYSPFDYINQDAKVVIVGLTPGRHQAQLASTQFKTSLNAGLSMRDSLKAAKNAASFAGPMRSNLVALLDSINVQQYLQIDSCADLFSNQCRLVHYTSLLRYPVFQSDRNYSGKPSILKTPFLSAQLEAWFLDELKSLQQCIFIPLGDEVHRTLQHAACLNGIDGDRILAGLPHPSGANAERIACFLGKKPIDQLSRQTNGHKILLDRTRLERQMNNLLVQ